jgi:hypothetical protein
MAAAIHCDRGRDIELSSSGDYLRRQDMRFLALLVALLIVVVGLAGVFAPDRLITVGRYVVTPVGLYAIAALRIGIGLVLMVVAPVSRAPKTLRAFGAVVFIAGLVTPLFGVERTRAIVDWEATQGTFFVRVGAGLAVAIGSFIAFAVAAGRRPA